MNINFDAKKLQNICEANDISYLGLFGSYAIGRQREDSDIDLLVDFHNTKSLLEKGKVLVELQNLFKREVDLVSRRNVKPSFKPFINEQLITFCMEKSNKKLQLYQTLSLEFQPSFSDGLIGVFSIPPLGRSTFSGVVNRTRESHLS